jgi:hypothetical protein
MARASVTAAVFLVFAATLSAERQDVTIRQAVDPN